MIAHLELVLCYRPSEKFVGRYLLCLIEFTENHLVVTQTSVEGLYCLSQRYDS
jgi:hypothetical protein